VILIVDAKMSKASQPVAYDEIHHRRRKYFTNAASGNCDDAFSTYFVVIGLWELLAN
jgi:hypothetical protein